MQNVGFSCAAMPLRVGKIVRRRSVILCEGTRTSLTQTGRAQALQDTCCVRLCFVLRPSVREPDVLGSPE